jgi:hypothetical protein
MVIISAFGEVSTAAGAPPKPSQSMAAVQGEANVTDEIISRAKLANAIRYDFWRFNIKLLALFLTRFSYFDYYGCSGLGTTNLPGINDLRTMTVIFSIFRPSFDRRCRVGSAFRREHNGARIELPLSEAICKNYRLYKAKQMYGL